MAIAKALFLTKKSHGASGDIYLDEAIKIAESRNPQIGIWTAVDADTADSMTVKDQSGGNSISYSYSGTDGSGNPYYNIPVSHMKTCFNNSTDYIRISISGDDVTNLLVENENDIPFDPPTA